METVQDAQVELQQAPNTSLSQQQGSGIQDDLEALFPDSDDLLYEEEVLRNPYSLKAWWKYLEATKDAPLKRRYVLYERSLQSLPGSYKLWHIYLTERTYGVRGLSPEDPLKEHLCNVYERALVTMHKMPRIWLMYLEELVSQCRITKARRTFDRALCALPITQHDRIWVQYLKFVAQPDFPTETATRVYQRYLKLEPGHAEEYIAFLKAKEKWGEAAEMLAKLVNDETFRSIEGKSRHDLWTELCDIITKHPEAAQSRGAGFDVEGIIRSGIRKHTVEVGRLWHALADYYIRKGMFERARDIFEESISSVMSVRDFTLLFDAYTDFEERLLEAKMEQIAEEDEEEEEEEEDDDGEDFLIKDDGNDVDLRAARLERLIERRAELLSSVKLRQNPHNVSEWLRRIELFPNDPQKQILTYTEAVKTVDPEKATGTSPSALWIGFANFYFKHKDVKNARVIFEKATQTSFKYVEDLAEIYCAWIEMELQSKNFKNALEIARSATEPNVNAPENNKVNAQQNEQQIKLRLNRNLKVWQLRCDLEESLGTLESTRAAYEKMLELRVSSPQTILNYALYLQEHGYWEDSFRAYERGTYAFKFPHSREIWQCYLQQFVERYKGTKLERTRDIFKQCIQSAPVDERKPFYLLFAEFEEQYGLNRRQMQILEEAVRKVPAKERLSIYKVFLHKAQQYFGLPKMREIFEMAIEADEDYQLPDMDYKNMILKYAELERSIGEIDRARAIFVHGASVADPTRDHPIPAEPGQEQKSYWQAWHAFEVAHGNEDTFREMLRIKRSVRAAFSQTHYNTSIVEAAHAADVMAQDGQNQEEEEDANAQLQITEQQTEILGTRVPGFVSGGTLNKDQAAQGAEQQEQQLDNPEELDIDGDEMEVDGDVQLQQKPVPDEVFQSVGGKREQLGALERFKKKAQV